MSMLNKDPEGPRMLDSGDRLRLRGGWDSLGSTMREMALSVRMVLAARYWALHM